MSEKSPYLNAEIGEEYKEKLEEIADKQKRNLKNQVQVMIDDWYEKVVEEE